MRLRKEVIERLACSLAHELIRFGYVDTEMTEDGLRYRLTEWIAGDLRVEDSLNEEVREILANFEARWIAATSSIPGCLISSSAASCGKEI